MFENYKKLNDENLHRAVLLTFVSCDGYMARYFLHNNSLVIAVPDIDKLPAYFFETLGRLVPKEYGTFNVWPIEKFNEIVPEKVQEETGYVSLYHDEYNVF